VRRWISLCPTQKKQNGSPFSSSKSTTLTKEIAMSDTTSGDSAPAPVQNNNRIGRALDMLVDLYDLKVWGDTLLTGPAKAAMRRRALQITLFTAYLLPLVTLTGVLLLNHGELEFKLIPLMVGTFAAIAMTGTIVNLDTEITTDDTRTLIRKEGESLLEYAVRNKGTMGRIFFVILCVVVPHTGLMVTEMKGDITRRLAEEATIAAGIQLIKTNQNTQDNVDRINNGETVQDGALQRTTALLEQTRQDLREARAAEAELHTQIQAQESIKAQAEQDIINNRYLLQWNPDAIVEYEEAKQAATRELERLNKELSATTERIVNLEKAVDADSQRTRELDDAIIAQQSTSSRELQQLQSFITELSMSDGSTPVEIPTGGVVRLDHPGLHVQFEVCMRLMMGLPHRWPPHTAETEALAKEVYSGIPLFDKEATGKIRPNIGLILWNLVVLLFCLFFELSVPLLKFSAPRALKNYYNPEMQALAGNTQAIKQMVAEYGEHWEHILKWNMFGIIPPEDVRALILGEASNPDPIDPVEPTEPEEIPVTKSRDNDGPHQTTVGAYKPSPTTGGGYSFSQISEKIRQTMNHSML
jgi:hypothetical protein